MIFSTLNLIVFIIKYCVFVLSIVLQKLESLLLWMGRSSAQQMEKKSVSLSFSVLKRKKLPEWYALRLASEFVVSIF